MARYCSMAAISASTLSKLPRRMRCWLRSRPALHEVEPRAAGGGEVKVKAGMPPEPALDGRALVGAGVVEDQVQRQVARRLAVDAVEEVQELTRPVPRHASADHLPIEEIERGEERRGAMAVVVVRLPGRDARAQRE